MKRAPQSITSVPESPQQETGRRQRQYAIAMGIRVLCLVACVFVRDWWLLIPAIGALVLPYVAVVLGNVGSRRSRTVMTPATLELPPGNDVR